MNEVWTSQLYKLGVRVKGLCCYMQYSVVSEEQRQYGFSL